MNYEGNMKKMKVNEGNFNAMQRKYEGKGRYEGNV